MNPLIHTFYPGIYDGAGEGQPTKGMGYAAVINLLKEKKGTGTLKLVFLKPATPRTNAIAVPKTLANSPRAGSVPKTLAKGSRKNAGADSSTASKKPSSMFQLTFKAGLQLC